jgi:ribosomal protein L11 methyltransferase
MTYIAVWRLAEAPARRLSDALAEQLAVTIDMTQSRRTDWIVTAYFDAAPDRTALRRIFRDTVGGQASVKISELADQDWVAKSLATLGPVQAGRYRIHGSHDRGAGNANAIAIEIEAATAFGTGHHGTTAGCLRALSDLAKRRRIRSAMDVGTGSGVLAIAIAKTWRVPVIATDIDPIAVAVAAANARLNRAARDVRAVCADGLHHGLVRRSAPFDLIVANILAAPLAKFAPAIAANLAPGGTLILSGLLPDQRRWITAAYRTQGLALRRASVLDGWLTLIFERRPFARRTAAA